MLFKKALRRDLANLAGVIFATLFTIMVTTSLIRLLGSAASGSVDSASVLPLIAFSAVNYLPVLLILTLYVSVLMALLFPIMVVANWTAFYRLHVLYHLLRML